ncbi:MAG: MBL fold metallo-hydrolase [Gammaproteobacteria bacterium]|nr:MBL fold metallo-hydrolase [Gammaproteobacteria bacterium]
MSERITNNVTWVGKRDWELRNFHGYEYSTNRGSTYNSYLVADQKIALIDTVWLPFAKQFVKDLSLVIDPHKIDYVIANHGEIDHSGALPTLMEQIPIDGVRPDPTPLISALPN